MEMKYDTDMYRVADIFKKREIKYDRKLGDGTSVHCIVIAKKKNAHFRKL
jgi:hypothetical protein